MTRTVAQKFFIRMLLTFHLLLPATITLASETGIPLERTPVDLITAYQDALKNDPTFQQQLAAYLSSKEAVPQAVSVLLPQLSLTASASRTNIYTNLTGIRRFNSDSFGASLSQAVFNLNAFYTLSSAKASVRAAAIQLSADLQDLIIRLTTAYLNVLQAQDVLHYNAQQQSFLRRTYHVTSERYRLKHATITDLEFAKGSYKEAQSQYVAAEISLYNSVQQLSQITGVRYARLASLGPKLPMISPNPENLHQWVESARLNNLSLNASRVELMAAASRISAKKGDYFPVLNAVASWDDINGAIAGLTRNTGIRQVTKTTNYGLDMSWPIFQGGLTNSEVRQQKAEYERTWGVMRQRFLDALANTRIAYEAVVEGRKQTLFGRNAVRAFLSSVTNGEEAYRGGAISIFDILQSQTRLFTAQNRYAQSLYSYLLNTLVLKQQAGTLAPNSIGQLNRYLKPGVKHTFKRRRPAPIKLKEIKQPEKDKPIPPAKPSSIILPNPGVKPKISKQKETLILPAPDERKISPKPKSNPFPKQATTATPKIPEPNETITTIPAPDDTNVAPKPQKPNDNHPTNKHNIVISPFYLKGYSLNF